MNINKYIYFFFFGGGGEELNKQLETTFINF